MEQHLFLKLPGKRKQKFTSALGRGSVEDNSEIQGMWFSVSRKEGYAGRAKETSYS